MKEVPKPWGEELWLEHNEKYCVKRIFIRQGARTSLQFHRQKHETNYILSGEADILVEGDNGEIRAHRVQADDCIVIPPTRQHRIIAITDLVLIEASTPEVDDVVRVADDFGRSSEAIGNGE